MPLVLDKLRTAKRRPKLPAWFLQQQPVLMKEQHMQLQLQAHELQMQKERMEFEERLLQSLCAIQGQRRRVVFGMDGIPSAHDDSDLWHQDVTSADEQVLCQLWSSSQCSSRCSSPGPLRRPAAPADAGGADGSTLDDGSATLAPVHDPTLLLRTLYTQPLHPAAASITLPELQQVYSATIEELILQMQQHAANLTEPVAAVARAAEGPTPLAKAQQALISLLQLKASIALARRTELLVGLALLNHHTGEVLPEPNKGMHWKLLQQLGLTDAQQRRIAYGAGLFKRLLEPVLQELRQLQSRQQQVQQQQQQQQQPPAAAPDTAGSSSSSSGSQSNEAAAASVPSSVTMPHPFDNGHRLQQEQAWSLRLKQLLAKDAMLRSYATCVLFGCLTWTQLAHLYVLSWPFTPSPAIFSQVVTEHVQQQHQQQTAQAFQLQLRHVRAASSAMGGSKAGSAATQQDSQGRQAGHSSCSSSSADDACGCLSSDSDVESSLCSRAGSSFNSGIGSSANTTQAGEGCKRLASN